MKPSIQTLGQILYSPSQFLIPAFQRDYRWEELQWDQLWTSLQAIQNPAKISNHFMGFLVFMPGLPQPGQNTRYHVIDGQQRLTSICLLLAALRNVARESGQSELADEIQNFYLIHPLKRGDARLRLLPKERDFDSYVALIDQQPPSLSRIARGVAYFEGRLRELGPEHLRLQFDAVVQRLEFMCATLEAENAYSIFKSLNSTGVALGEADLIRNFVFMHVQPEEQDDFGRTLWRTLEADFGADNGRLDEVRFSDFFRDLLMSEGSYISPKQTFASFEAKYIATGFNPRQLTRDLIQRSEHYQVVSGRRPDPEIAVTEAVQRLNALDSSTCYPLLLALWRQRAEGELSTPDLARALQMLRGFLLRRYICGESGHGYGQVFVRAAAQCQPGGVDWLQQFLEARGWPDDARFVSALLEWPMYKRKYGREILSALERATGHKEPADLSQTEIEHILPQTLSEDWRLALGPEADLIQQRCLHTLGNLTLSGYNLELWNHPFAVKSARYAESNIGITRQLAQWNTWSETEVRERANILATQASLIWTGPRQPIMSVSPAERAPKPLLDRAPKPMTERAAALVESGAPRFARRQEFWEQLVELLERQCPELAGFSVRPSPKVRLTSGVPQLGLEAQYHAGTSATVRIWFWRDKSWQVLEHARENIGLYNEMFDGEWQFHMVQEGERGYMALSSPEGLNQPAILAWLAEKLTTARRKALPALSQLLSSPPSPAASDQEWDHYLPRVTNSDLVQFTRAHIDAGGENGVKGHRLYFRVEGRRRFMVEVRTGYGTVWQEGRFPGDQDYWQSRLSDATIAELNDGNALRYYLKTQDDFSHLLAATEQLKSIRWV